MYNVIIKIVNDNYTNDSSIAVSYTHLTLPTICIDGIAGSIGLVYPTCYAYHFDSNHVHCHMVISATPFLPAPEPLTGMNLANYITIKMNSSGFTFDINDEGGFLNV